MENCLFCKIISSEIPSKKIYEDEYIFAILDINPVTSGHFLVLPKKHFDTFENTDDKYLEKMITIARDLATKIKEVLGSSGFNLNINNGESAGQVILHTHFHVVQRFGNDNLALWPNDPQEKEKIEKVYKKIINNIK